MFTIYCEYYYYEGISSAKEMQRIFKEKYDVDISYPKVLRTFKRVKNLNKDYLHDLFDKQIDKELSYVWDEIKQIQKEKLMIEFINKYKDSQLSMDELKLKMGKEIFEKCTNSVNP